MRKHTLDPVETQVDEVVHTLHSRYPLFTTLYLIRHAVATATLGIVAKMHLSRIAQRRTFLKRAK